MFRLRRRPPASLPEQSPQLTAAPPPEPASDSLLEAQKHIFNRDDTLRIIDVGAHHGHTSRQYLETFPNCRVIALEPASTNRLIAAELLAPFGDRVELLPEGVSDREGTAELRLTSHSGAHSLLEVGDMRYYDSPVDVLPPERIATVTIDSLCRSRDIETLDILKMDIQGGELMALKGSHDLLQRGSIRAIVLEVLFQDLYKDQPKFLDLANHLRTYDYALQGIYEPRYQPGQPALLCWADAIFVAPSLTKLADAG